MKTLYESVEKLFTFSSVNVRMCLTFQPVNKRVFLRESSNPKSRLRHKHKIIYAKHDMKKHPKRIDLEPEQTEAILERVKAALGDGDYQIIKAAFETIAFLMRLLEKKTTSINRLRQMLFGWRTEKSKKVLKEDKKKDSPDVASDKGEKSSEQENGTNKPDKKKKTKPKGHGRKGADAYSAADKVKISHAKLRSGTPCPICPKGKIYPLLDPKRIVRVMGKAPLSATVYELERLRCNLCGKVFTADLPENITKSSERENSDVAKKKTKVAKYDETAGSMIANMKYGSGFPWYRMEKLQENLGIPLSASTQWDIVEKVADRIRPVFEELKKQAAQGEVIHNDDTIMKVLELMNPPGKQSEQDQKKTGRSGVFTTGCQWSSKNVQVSVIEKCTIFLASILPIKTIL